MNTEQLKQAAMAATPGPWCFGTFYRLLVVPFSEGQPNKHDPICAFVGTDKENENNADFIAAANPFTILALLECVDALRDMLEQFTKTPSTLKDSQARVKGHAALQKLEAL